MRAILLGSALVLLCQATCGAVELWVDRQAAGGGNGSADKPYGSIGEAVRAAKGGDTITVRQGVYEETVTLAVSGTEPRPTVLRAAPGQRVVVSGFATVRGWKQEQDGVYTATVEGPVSDLYVGLHPQPVARWPDFDQPMRRLAKPDAKANTFQDPSPLPHEAFLDQVATTPKSAMAYLYVASGNYYSTISVTRLDRAKATVTVAPTKWFGNIKGEADRFQLANHPGLIAKPGQWAMEAIDPKQTRIYFRPARPEDLEHTQCRKARGCVLRVGHGRDPVEHLRVEGLEICGSTGSGLQIEGAGHVTVSRCVFHNNADSGCWSRRSNHVELRNNLSIANGSGLSIVSTDTALVEGNEVALNMVDGIVVAGNISGRPDGEPTTSNVTVRKNYVHHHLLLSHPDNFQAYRGVKNLVLEDNLFLWGGQGIMTEEVDGARLRNCVIVGTGAVAVIFGHGNSNQWTVENCTVGLGGWGSFSLTGKEYRLQRCIIWNNPLSMAPTLASDYNLYAVRRPDQHICLTSKPRWKAFAATAEVAEATGQEKHSLRGDPQFRNAPIFQAVADYDPTDEAGRLVISARREAGLFEFQKGDAVEINGDGVLRRVTEVEDRAIRFEPPLPRRPFRDSLVWNWKEAASPSLDLRPQAGSPALTLGEGARPVGANLDIPAYQRGDFDGDGRRDLLEMPQELKEAMPNPNCVVIPLEGR